MAQDFQGKVVVITGAGAGIGQAAALAFSRKGAKVVVNSRSQSSTMATVNALLSEGGDAYPVWGDVSQEGMPEAIIRAVVEHYGRIDVLVNNAGIVVPGTIDTLSVADLDRSYTTNVRSIFLLTQGVIPYLRKNPGGVIVNIASIAGLKGTKNRLAYSATKGALISMSRSLALELAPEQIRVNCICPGMTKSPSLAQRISAMPDPDAAEAGFIAAVPMGRLGQPEDIAEAIVFAASDACPFLTGAVITVDGGKSL